MTTGLIGTDRRPVPDALPASWGSGLDHASDPAHAVLSIAARHRAASRAGDLLLSCPPGPSGPPNRAPFASRAAHEILARLLSATAGCAVERLAGRCRAVWSASVSRLLDSFGDGCGTDC